jgi:hypothetical protein
MKEMERARIVTLMKRMIGERELGAFLPVGARICLLAAIVMAAGIAPTMAGQSVIVGGGEPAANLRAQQAGAQAKGQVNSNVNGRTGGHVRGRVVDQTGVAAAGATVKLTVDGQTASQETVTEDDGRFSFANVAPGAFQLTIVSAGFATQTIAGNLKAGEDDEVAQVTLAIATKVTEVRVTPPTFEVAEAQIKEQEKQRALGFIPNFYVTYVPNAAPLAPKQKFELAWKSMVDPVTFGITGAVAGIEQATNQYSGFGQGMQGYAKRFGAAYADMATGTLIGGAILPSLLKQDPRYFYKGTGSAKSRILYAVANSVICKGDNGKWQANYSGILGGLAAGGISNLYYPAQDRNGVGLTFENALIGIGATAAANVLQEFVIKKLTPSAAKVDPNAGATKAGNPVSKVWGTLVRAGG